MPILRISDMVDLDDPQGRTYREVNNATEHRFKLSDLVELDNGVRLFVTKLTRDCDGTPLYCLGAVEGISRDYGYSERSLKAVNLKATT